MKDNKNRIKGQVPSFEECMENIKKQARCRKCGERILGDEDSLCGGCI